MDVNNVKAQFILHLLHQFPEDLGLGDECDALGSRRDGGISRDARFAGANVVGKDDAPLEAGQASMEHLNVGEFRLHAPQE